MRLTKTLFWSSELHVNINSDAAVYIVDLPLKICENYEKRLINTIIFLIFCSFDIRLTEGQSGLFNC